MQTLKLFDLFAQAFFVNVINRSVEVFIHVSVYVINIFPKSSLCRKSEQKISGALIKAFLTCATNVIFGREVWRYVICFCNHNTIVRKIF